MKLVVAIVGDERSPRLTENLTAAGFSATKLASTGGFLHKGNATFLIGVEADQVETAIDNIRRHCRSKKPPARNASEGATIFVIDIPRLIRV